MIKKEKVREIAHHRLNWIPHQVIPEADFKNSNPNCNVMAMDSSVLVIAHPIYERNTVS